MYTTTTKINENLIINRSKPAFDTTPAVDVPADVNIVLSTYRTDKVQGRRSGPSASFVASTVVAVVVVVAVVGLVLEHFCCKRKMVFAVSLVLRRKTSSARIGIVIVLEDFRTVPVVGIFVVEFVVGTVLNKPFWVG